PPPQPQVVAPPPVPERSGGSQRAVGFVVGGVGLVGIGVGTVFGLQAISKSHDANGLCPSSPCGDHAGVTLNDDAKRAATISTIAVGVGAAAVVAGVVLIV